MFLKNQITKTKPQADLSSPANPLTSDSEISLLLDLIKSIWLLQDVDCSNICDELRREVQAVFAFVQSVRKVNIDFVRFSIDFYRNFWT